MENKYIEELEEGFSSLTVTEEASRCLLCLDAPCSKACPAGTSPDKFIRSVRFRNFKGAAETVRENNALGAICARVCPTEKYCQKGCSRSGIDRPIDIGRIQRFITDFEDATKMKILAKGPSNGKKVAIIGSGPAALQASVTLNNLGYSSVIFEKEGKAGGMLNLIPEYRLPTKVVQNEIKRIKDLGVEFRLGVEVGKDVSMDELKKEFDAVILAVGYSYGKSLPLFEGNRNVILAVDFLKKVKARKGNVKMPDNILVVGGGDVAMDVVSTLKLIGVDHITDVVYEQFKEFKASKKELKNAQELSVTIIDGYVPTKAKGKTVTFSHREIDSVLKIKANKIILAVGQMPNVEGLGVELVKGEVNTGKDFLTADPKVFVAGDLAHSQFDKTVVGAVRTGKEVALAVDNYLRRAK